MQEAEGLKGKFEEMERVAAQRQEAAAKLRADMEAQRQTSEAATRAREDALKSARQVPTHAAQPACALTGYRLHVLSVDHTPPEMPSRASMLCGLRGLKRTSHRSGGISTAQAWSNA